LPPHLVLGVVDVGDDVELVKNHLRLVADVFFDSGDGGGAQVDGDLRDRSVVAVVFLKGLGKGFPHFFVLARDGKEHALADEIAEDAHVVVALAYAHFSAAHAAHLAPVCLADRPLRRAL
jgi:hypothetical protein